jgi:outer membrane protein OmpA-like peptidoglycan-associated protein
MASFYSRFFFSLLHGRTGVSLIIIITISLFATNVQSQQGLKAEYYDGTEFDSLVATKYVANINESWYDNAPVPGIDPHECSIRWTGKLSTAITGSYTFSAQVDDGIRVWIDDQLIMDQWDLNDVGIFEGTTDLVEHKEYDLKVEYFNGLLEGEVRLLWKKNKEELTWYEQVFGDGIKPTVIPARNFLSPDKPIKIEKEPDLAVKPKKKEKQIPAKKESKPIQVKKENVVKKPHQNSVILQPKEVKKPEIPKPIVSAKVAEKFIPKNVQFEKGNTNILENSYEELDAFIKFLLEYPQLDVMVEGHTDVVGDAELNLILSKDRAKMITEYLVEKGVANERITPEGFGGSRPLFVPGKGKYYPANRRVVFIIDGLE